MLHLTGDKNVDALIMDVATQGELYGEEWEDYKAHIDSQPPEEWLDEMAEDAA